MANKANRPSPTDSATWYQPGTYKIGNDGNMYAVAITHQGVHKWHRTTITNGQEYIMMSPKHPNYVPTHKFKVGDRVRVVRHGIGCSMDEMHKEVTITELGTYITGGDGYKVDPPTGNMLISAYGGMIGEQSFELISEAPLEKTLDVSNIKPLNFKKMARTTKTITKKSAQDVRCIETSLINKEEVFKMLALAESTGLPLLLVGDPGVAKTKTIIEYAKAWLNKDGKMSQEDFMNKLYILETDEGTKASEIKGMPNLQKLFTENKYELDTPIANADIVIINEVDKASSAIRNAMLGVMNEKFLFNGKSKVPCKWKLFVATCNEIPKEEVGSPFWDRFMLKMTVGRVSAGDMSKYYSKGAREYREKFNIGIPNDQEINSVEITSNKLDRYLEVGYTYSSDRTLTFVPRLTKAVSFIWDSSIDKALVKTAEIMINKNAASELSNKLMSSELKNVMSKVEMLHSYNTNEQLELAIGEIESMINSYAGRGLLDATQVEEIEHSMNYIIQNHPARKDYQTTDEFEALVDESQF